ncbi:MAG: cation-translocating P-type ATPase [Myxococcaceae bacterium]|nr:cation-translocating P-type ATPase [Myxococcaceae bacterium]
MHTSRGLTAAEAAERLEAHGLNALEGAAKPSVALMLLGQLKSPVVLLLLVACALSAVLGELADAVAIGAIVVLDAAVGFFQEYRAERAMQALRSMTAPRARVRRDGATLTIAAAHVVPGDLLVLEAGDVVAADARLVRAHQLATNEAPLTGESAQVEKSHAPAPVGAPLAERSDHVFMGTSVGKGTGTAEVVATGMRTELGRIAGLLSTASQGETPLQRRLAVVGRMLLFGCVAVVAVVGAVQLVRGGEPLDVMRAAVALAIAAVPEGLSAIVTVALAIGVQRMSRRHALVRKLPAVETLGCASVICTDKTGTLTTGAMTVRELWGPDERALLEAAAACCDAELAHPGRPAVGDTTELAILAAARARGIERADLERSKPRLSERPFDAQRKRMSIWRADGCLYVKGAPEVMLPRCSAGTQGAAQVAAGFAARGLRVLAVAVGARDDEEALRLVGLVAMADPPRPEAVAAVKAAAAAGIVTVMITGDHPLTANAIAAELGIEHVHARATPEDKLKIVRDWKARGEVVAMTGDGVNDAPALREAHIGVAMGRTGTEVTREAADVVLTDDDFATIVAAVREGRGIFDNIRKVLVYLLSGNAAKLLLMFVSSVAGLPAPLLPLHLLWVNLVIDGFMALALVNDAPGPEVMQRPPRRVTEAILGGREWLRVLGAGLLETALVFGAYVVLLQRADVAVARSFTFALLVFVEVFKAFSARSPKRIFWEVGAFANLALLGVVLGAVAMQALVHQLESTRGLLGIVSLSPGQWLAAAGLGLVPVTLVEVQKLARRRCAR